VRETTGIRSVVWACASIGMITKTTNAAFMIERDKILQDIVCFLCDGEVPSLAIPASGQRGLRQRIPPLFLTSPI
jgi:hypothetical protein